MCIIHCAKHVKASVMSLYNKSVFKSLGLVCMMNIHYVVLYENTLNCMYDLSKLDKTLKTRLTNLAVENVSKLTLYTMQSVDSEKEKVH